MKSVHELLGEQIDYQRTLASLALPYDEQLDECRIYDLWEDNEWCETHQQIASMCHELPEHTLFTAEVTTDPVDNQ
jgi:hypothetical protein